jgi:T-complex protein 1 subunit beta
MVDEAERSLHDALSALSQTVLETCVVLVGGCSKMLMACAVDERAQTVLGKMAIAVEAFGRALRQIPTILADNAGFDLSELGSARPTLRARARAGSIWASATSGA